MSSWTSSLTGAKSPPQGQTLATNPHACWEDACKHDVPQPNPAPRESHSRFLVFQTIQLRIALWTVVAREASLSAVP